MTNDGGQKSNLWTWNVQEGMPHLCDGKSIVMKAGIHRRFTVITCSRLSNTGKLTTQAAMRLGKKGYSGYPQWYVSMSDIE